ncbi:MAG: ABC transporter permease [Candidatus Lernaella stagnicola]|nr:ABC transporter permease [Candidatus Lernaella stagnicola]
MRSRIPAIARKEMTHILRDWRTLAMAFVMPTILILLFGYAITFDIKNLRVAVADQDQSKASRNLIRRLSASEYFVITARPHHPEQLPGLLEDGTAQVALAIPEGFAKTLERNEPETIQVIIDGSESNTATIGSGYVAAVVQQYNLDLLKDTMARVGISTEGLPPLDVRVRVWFNPTADSPTSIVPGLVAVIIVMMAALLTSLTVVRERENGSLEGLFATPVRRQEILIGKTIPYLVIAMADTALVAGIGVFVFGVPFAGSILAFSLTALIFTFTGLGIGMVASVMSDNQMLANQIVILVTMLPSFLLSGFMFPIKSMPGWVQVITYAVPARYFIQISRAIMLKGTSLWGLLAPTGLLLIVAVVVSACAMQAFKKKL